MTLGHQAAIRFEARFRKGEPNIYFNDARVVDRFLVAEVERGGLGIMVYMDALRSLLLRDGCVDDLEIAAFSLDLVGYGLDVVSGAAYVEMILVPGPFVAPERVVGRVVPRPAVASAAFELTRIELQ